MNPDALRQRSHGGAAHGEHEQPRPTGDVAGLSGHDAGECTPLIRVTCLGGFAAYRCGEQIQHWENRKARELLAYLATRVRCAATHAEIVEVLWPDDDFVTGQRLLYTAAWSLRKSLDEDAADDGVLPVARASHSRHCRAVSTGSSFRASVLASDRGRYALNRSLCVIDLAELREQLDRLSQDVSLAERLTLAMRASHPCFVGETYPWLRAVRNQLRSRGLAALRQVAQRALSDGNISLALTALHRRLELDPTHEESVAQAMRLHVHRSEFAAASDCYRSLCVALKHASNYRGAGFAAPSAELQTLFAAVHTRDSSSGPSNTARPPPIKYNGLSFYCPLSQEVFYGSLDPAATTCGVRAQPGRWLGERVPALYRSR